MRKSKRIMIYIRELPNFVKLASVVSLSSLLILKLWLFKVPAIFPGANDFGDLYYELCLATAGAVIFYIGVNHIPSIQRKKKVAVYIDQIYYQNWYIAIDRYHSEMREHLRDLLLLSETFSAEMLEAITKLENQFTAFNIARGRYAGNNSLEMWGHALYACHTAYNGLYKQLREEFGQYLR